MNHIIVTTDHYVLSLWHFFLFNLFLYFFFPKMWVVGHQVCHFLSCLKHIYIYQGRKDGIHIYCPTFVFWYQPQMSSVYSKNRRISHSNAFRGDCMCPSVIVFVFINLWINYYDCGKHYHGLVSGSCFFFYATIKHTAEA